MQAITEIQAPPSPELAMSVVIPACNEPGLMHTLESLAACARPGAPVEVIAVINHSEKTSNPTITANETSLARVLEWTQNRNEPGFSVYPLYFPNLLDKQAGVGLARKLGLDLAVQRQHAAGVGHGILANLDADCLVEPSYLQAVWGSFANARNLVAASIHFAHRLDELDSGPRRMAATLYELHLRLYVTGLRHATYPYAYHTIGSCMAVRSRDYLSLGGMNRRQAGEDFYFLEKFMLHGTYGNVTQTCVYPSARISNRAPFGTGATISEWSQQPESALTYPLRFYRDIGQLMQRLDEFYGLAPREFARTAASLPGTLAAYLEGQGFSQAIMEINANTGSVQSFRKRLLRWLRPFRVMKYANLVRQTHGAEPVANVARELAIATGMGDAVGAEPRALLKIYRELDRNRG